MPATIKPELSKIILSDILIIFLYFNINVITNNKNAAIQNGIATLVKNSKGIPATVKPRKVRKATKAVQALWQT